MNLRNRKSDASPALSDATLDAVLGNDTILPSSGFVASVMATVESEATAPALAFPWKRAIPGLVAAAAVLALLLGVVVSLVLRAFQTGPRAAAPLPAASPGWHLDLQPLFHSTGPAAVFWVMSALVLSAGTLLLCRRLLSSR